MKIQAIAAAIGAAGMLVTGLGMTTASASTKPAVMVINHQGTLSPYRQGRLQFDQGPSVWLSHPHFTAWNSHEAVATGALWGSDVGTFSLGHHATLVFSRVRHHRFTELTIRGGHGIVPQWHLMPSINSWAGGRL
ncbi:MAG: hypothetical protein ACHP9Z_30415 [Streptosporangiales bacterium]|jgi:hypothetical protein